MNYYNIGQRIRKYRKIANMSQEQLAECVGISVTHMSHIETGNTKLSLPVLVSIANALNVSTDTLIHDNLPQKTSSITEINEILDSCSENELRVIVDTLKSLKLAFDKYL